MSSNITWFGLLCGAILLGGDGLNSAVAANDPAAPAALARPALPGVKSAAPNESADLAALVPDEDNTFRYAVIVQQNAFRLNPVPPPPPPPPPPAPDLPNVKLSGFRTEGDTTVAMFAISIKKSPKDPKETTSYVSLKEGEKGGPSGGELELLKIDAKQEEVTVLNSGTRVVLTMRDNGFESKPTAAAGTPGPAGLQRTPATPIRGNPAVPTMPGMPAPSAAPGPQAINLGSTTGGGGPSSRTDMIVGGVGGVTANKTVATAPVVASSGSSSDLRIGGYTPPPATPAVPGLNATPISPTPGGTPPNFAPANPTPPRPGELMPPMPQLPTIGR